jgi:cell division transport system ATP-binding protein
MKRRVIELISGQIVRDERGGGYQTTSIPIQHFSEPTALPDTEVRSA